MRNQRATLTSLIFGLILVAPTVAQAQDSCSDVLPEHGPYQTVDTKYRSSFDAYYYRKFVDLSEDEAKRTHVWGSDINLADYVMGSANYSDQDYEKRKSNVRDEIDSRLHFAEDSSVLIQSGDPVILSAWTSCMRDRGAYAYFKNTDDPQGHVVILTVNFSSTTVDGVTIRQIDWGQLTPTLPMSSCLREGQRVSNTSPCTVQIALPKASDTLQLTINFDHGPSASASLLPRFNHIVSEARPFPSNRLPDLAGTANNLHGSYWDFVTFPPVTASLTIQEIDDGWIFLPQTAKAPVIVTVNNTGTYSTSDPRGQCTEATFRVDAHSFTYSFRYRNHTAWGLACQVEAQIEWMRDHWTYMDQS